MVLIPVGPTGIDHQLRLIISGQLLLGQAGIYYSLLVACWSTYQWAYLDVQLSGGRYIGQLKAESQSSVGEIPVMYWWIFIMIDSLYRWAGSQLSVDTRVAYRPHIGRVSIELKDLPERNVFNLPQYISCNLPCKACQESWETCG